MKTHILEVLLNKNTFKDLDHAEKICKKWGYKTDFRKKKGIETEEHYIFKQRDKSRYINKQKRECNENLILIVGVKK
jgi:hypothetical protein